VRLLLGAAGLPQRFAGRAVAHISCRCRSAARGCGSASQRRSSPHAAAAAGALAGAQSWCRWTRLQPPPPSRAHLAAAAVSQPSAALRAIRCRQLTRRKFERPALHRPLGTTARGMTTAHHRHVDGHSSHMHLLQFGAGAQSASQHTENARASSSTSSQPAGLHRREGHSKKLGTTPHRHRLLHQQLSHRQLRRPVRTTLRHSRLSWRRNWCSSQKWTKTRW
jgi:hypothetical protein